MHMTTTDVSPLTRALAERLRVEMAKLRIQQTDLARLSGVGQSTISRVLAEKRVLTTDELFALCDALGVDAGAVLTEARASAAPAPEPEASDTALPATLRKAGDTPPRGGPKVVQPTRRSASSRGKRSHESN